MKVSQWDVQISQVRQIQVRHVPSGQTKTGGGSAPEYVIGGCKGPFFTCVEMNSLLEIVDPRYW